MSQLTKEQDEALKKCSTERLRSRLITAGEDAEIVNKMDRLQLLEAITSVILSDGEKAAQAKAPISDDLRQKEIALEEKRLDAELRRLQIEAIERDKEREQRRFEIEAEERRQQQQREHEIRKLELRSRATGEVAEAFIDESRDANPGQIDNSLARRTKQYGDTLKHVLPSMPREIAELPQFFDTVEKLYEMYQVPADLQAKLLIPLLTDKAKSIIVRMSVTSMENYEEVKLFLHAEYKLTPREYKGRFDNAFRKQDETCVLFAARLRNLLMYYLRSRQVDNDFEKVCDLLISDKLKSCLPTAALNYVLTLEGEDWFRPNKVASLADVYLNNHSQPTSSKFAAANTCYTNRKVTGNRLMKQDTRAYSKRAVQPICAVQKVKCAVQKTEMCSPKILN